jgi:hypothetical protein
LSQTGGLPRAKLHEFFRLNATGEGEVRGMDEHSARSTRRRGLELAAPLFTVCIQPDAEDHGMGKMEIDLAREEAAHAFMLEDADFADDDSEARNTLARGLPIYYTEPSTPRGLVIRESPDGRKDLLRVAPDGSFHVLDPA